ncbi:tetratricopeptide repeat protein [Telmatobacter bradus]|uniref:tetratricopeptide repeat protein n=1 Tax=Telmatobacter bradus TaxID=474953 RepID=UPI003B432F66
MIERPSPRHAFCLLLLFFAAAASHAQLPAPRPQIDPALQAKADAGDATAQIAVGEAWATAPGKAQDCKQAADWYRKAGASIDGALHLAILYRDGCKTLLRDMAQAAQWYKQAAAQGDVSAQGTLGSLYFMGQGVPQDYNEAYFWLDLAARSPGPKQQQYASNRQLVGTHITTDDVEAAKDRVETWLATHPHK